MMVPTTKTPVRHSPNVHALLLLVTKSLKNLLFISFTSYFDFSCCCAALCTFARLLFLPPLTPLRDTAGSNCTNIPKYPFTCTPEWFNDMISRNVHVIPEKYEESEKKNFTVTKKPPYPDHLVTGTAAVSSVTVNSRLAREFCARDSGLRQQTSGFPGNLPENHLELNGGNCSQTSSIPSPCASPV